MIILSFIYILFHEVPLIFLALELRRKKLIPIEKFNRAWIFYDLQKLRYSHRDVYKI